MIFTVLIWFLFFVFFIAVCKVSVQVEVLERLYIWVKSAWTLSSLKPISRIYLQHVLQRRSKYLGDVALPFLYLNQLSEVPWKFFGNIEIVALIFCIDECIFENLVKHPLVGNLFFSFDVAINVCPVRKLESIIKPGCDLLVLIDAQRINCLAVSIKRLYYDFFAIRFQVHVDDSCSITLKEHLVLVVDYIIKRKWRQQK